MHVDGDEEPGYALVHWFGVSEYPLGTPLVVRVRVDGSDIENDLGCAIKITSIDPSRVMTEHDVGDDLYYMMRDSGYDTKPTT